MTDDIIRMSLRLIRHCFLTSFFLKMTVHRLKRFFLFIYFLPPSPLTPPPLPLLLAGDNPLKYYFALLPSGFTALIE